MRKLPAIFLATLAILSGLLVGTQPAKALATDTSWNPQSAYCTASVTSLETVIGNQMNSFGGATYAGGGFKPGVPYIDKHSTSPPCVGTGVPANATFVEIDNVKIPFSVRESWDCLAATTFCDQSFNIQDPNCPTAISHPYLCSLYTEIDQNWEKSGVAPVNPPNGTLIDVQGFVFNETEKSVMASDHNFSPWEINSLTGWRLAGQTTPDFVVAPFHPSLTIPQGGTGVATVNVLGFNSFKSDVTLTLQIPAGITATLGTATIHAVSYGQNANSSSLTVGVPASIKSGDYLLNVTGTSGLISHTKMITIQVPWFTMFSTPGSKTVTPSTSFSSTIKILSESGFAGTVNLSGSVSPSGVAWQLNRTSVPVPAGGANAANLTIDTHGTPAGLYNITIVGTSGSLSSHASVMVNVIDFSISASPTSLNFPSGQFGVTRVTLTSFRSFVGNVTLSASVVPTGPTAKPFVNSLLLKANGSNSTTVRVVSTTPGSYILNVTGTVGSLSHSTFVTVTVPGFAVSVIVGQNGALSWSALSAGTWTSWSRVGLSSPSTPALCGSSGGRLDMIARGVDNGIYHMTFINSAWSNASLPGGATRDQPACAVLNGLLYIVVRGMDNSTYYDTMYLATGQWTGWVGLGGFTSSPPTLVVTPSVNRIDLIVRGVDNGIYHKAFVNGAWSASWDSPGGTTSAAPAATSDGSILHMVVRGSDNSTYYNTYRFSLGVWQGWISLQGATPAPPTLSIDSSGTIHLVVRGMNSVPYHRSLINGVWSPLWDTPAGLTPTAPSSIVLGTTLHLLVVGNDGQVYYNSNASATWSGWLGLGGSTSQTPALGIAQ